VDWDQLHYFKVLAKTNSFTHASNELNLSQPALSRSISRLEEEVGVPLFERKSRGVQLNQYGQIFLEHTNRALSELTEAKQKINDMVDPSHGTIHIAFVQTLSSSYVPDLISRFHEKYPGIQFQLSQNITRKILNEIHSAKINIGFCSPQEPYPQLSSIPIRKEELVLIVPKNHRLAGKESVQLHEVAEDPFIFFKPGTALYVLIENLCHQSGFDPKKTFEGFEERTVADLVGANLGVALIPRFSGLDTEKVSVIHVENPECYRTIEMVWKTNGYMSPAVSNFIKFVEQQTT